MISIHALLAESDWHCPPRSTTITYFYPRSPCGERLWKKQKYSRKSKISIHALLAESDPSLRVSISGRASFLSTLSLRRATFINFKFFFRRVYFYPRSPCGERQSHAQVTAAGVAFLSTLSLRRATAFAVYNPPGGVISIHALLAESDWVRSFLAPFFIISIHALLAESDKTNSGVVAFQVISIHALLAESDFAPFMRWVYARLFLSTLSLRRATK